MHAEKVLPRAVIARIVLDILDQLYDTPTRRIERKAVDLLHKEVERFSAEIFTSAFLIAHSCGKQTLHPHVLKNAVALRTMLLAPAY